MSALLSIEGLDVLLPRGADRAYAAQGVTLKVDAGEVLCGVGESGSGKSTLARCLL
jgi:peptide/nickel transport system ATP-binding protein